MRKDITFEELDSERVELLPSKETLHYGGHFFNANTAIWASNSSMAFNAATYHSNAYSQALQSISVNNHG